MWSGFSWPNNCTIELMMDIFSYFRNCKNCGRFEIKIYFFCSRCFLKLERERAPCNFSLSREGLIIRPLYIWRKNNDVVGNLVKGLKGGTPKQALEYFAKEIVRRNHNRDSLVVVPVPSTKVGVKDHAYSLAEVIANCCNYEMRDQLRWENKHTGQKFLKKTERFEANMLSEIDSRSKRQIVLVDDLVTTGATAMAARDAIKSPNKIEVWALACRE